MLQHGLLESHEKVVMTLLSHIPNPNPLDLILQLRRQEIDGPLIQSRVLGTKRVDGVEGGSHMGSIVFLVTVVTVPS